MKQKDQQTDPVISEEKLYQAFRLMKKKEFDAAKELIREGLKAAAEKKDAMLEGLYHSAHGVLYKLTGDYKKAFKSYQHAEQLIPEDLSLKIISAVLLVEQFKQYETAFRKLEKIIGLTEDPAITHHALTTQAIALFHMNKKEKAKEKFELAFKADFSLLRFVANVDFKAVDLFTRKGFELNLCEQYLSKALVLAQGHNDSTYVIVIEELLGRLGLYQDAEKTKSKPTP
jgi:tetratricopeptide (TPR) repeat protein